MTNFAKNIFFSLAALLILLSGCHNNYTPKPRGYFRIDLPSKKYAILDSTMPYSFEYSEYAIIENNTGKHNEPNWINLLYPNYKARIYISYKPVTDNLYDLLEDNIKLAYNHVVKADAIEEHLFINDDKNLYAMMFEIKGNAASPLQFLATDSARHFLRGSLYFQTIPNSDSLAPVVEYITQDVIHLIETIQWKN